MRVACLGECMVELREQPDGLMSRGFGGDTLNTALYLARLGVAADYVTALGTDPFSDAMMDAWRAEGVGTGAVARVAGRLPGLYLIQTDAQGERRFSYWRDAAPVRDLFHLPETPALEAALVSADAVYLSGITLSLFGAADRGRLFAVLDRLRRRGGRVLFDTNFRTRGWPDRVAARTAFAAMLSRSDLVFASVEDYALLHGKGEAAGSATEAELRAWLGEAGGREAVLRLPNLGCRVLSCGRMTAVDAALAERVVDTTAAGDSFAAAYIAARAAGEPPAAAAAAGHRLAGRVIAHPGAVIPRHAMADLLRVLPR